MSNKETNKQDHFHDNYSDHSEVKIGSERSFGLVFAVVFLIIGWVPLIKGLPVRWWAILTAGGLVAVAIAIPKALVVPNRLWFRLGLWLQAITSPLIMGLLFYGVLFPTGLLLRMMGKDLLRLKWQKDAKTYWIQRTPPGPSPTTMRDQF